MKKICAVILGLIILNASFAVAEEGVNFMNKVPTSDELVEALESPEQAPSMKLMGIQMKKKSPGQEAMEATSAEKPRVILDIKFEHDSYNLTAKAKQTLDALGRALNSDKLKQDTFVIEGHTDASGSAAYNMQLSERRAKKAAEYLQTACNVNGDRLVVKSYGESRPLENTAPESGANRRVEVVNAAE